MKVLGLVGSPRKNSNTDLIVSAILDAASASGISTERTYLYSLNIAPCIDCRACKQGNNQCNVKDAMQTLYPKLEAADVLVFGTPLYWYGPTATMKLLLDRLRPYISSKKLMGKRAVLVVPSEEGAEACKCTVDMFTLSFKYLGISLSHVLLPKAYERAEVQAQTETLNQALRIGMNLK